MSFIQSSFLVKAFNKLDLKEDSQIVKWADSSFLTTKINSLAGYIQDKVYPIVSTSKIIEYIDYMILFVLSMLILSIPLASTGIIGLVTTVAFLLLVIKFFFTKGEKWSFTSIDIAVFLYITIAGLSVTFSSLLMPSLKGYAKMLIYFGGYLTFLSLFRKDPRKIIYLICILTFSASMEAFYAIYQQITGVEPLASWQDLNEVNPEQLMNRVYGTLQPFNPNLLAGYLIASFAPALGLGFWFLSKKNWRSSIISFIATAAILLAIVFTGSRGAYIAVAIMSFCFMLVSGHIIWHDFGHIKWLKKLWLGSIVIGVGLVTLVILSSPALQHRILSIFIFRGDSSNSYRFNVYTSCLKIISDNWLTGIGPGNTTFRLIYGLYMVTGFDALGAYSVPLEVTVEMGIFGLLAFTWLILMAIIKGIKYIDRDNPFDSKIIVSACVIGIIGLMAHGLVDTVWYRPQINIIFWMLISILATILSKSAVHNR